MGQMKHTKPGHHVHHFVVSYPVTMPERLYTLLVGPLLVCLVVYLLVRLFPSVSGTQTLTLPVIVEALVATLLRIGVAYVFAAIIAVPIALLVEVNRTVESFLLPVFDVFESIPNLAVLPILLVFFMQFGFLDGAAVTILFLNMVWTIVLALVGGLKVIPQDVTFAARIFGLHGFSYIRRLILPGIFPQFVTGSILAVASAWNIIIVAEAVHAYIPNGIPSQDLFGIGTLLVSASAQGDRTTYAIVFFVMVATIALFNFFVWQRLLNYAQHFRFD